MLFLALKTRSLSPLQRWARIELPSSQTIFVRRMLTLMVGTRVLTAMQNWETDHCCSQTPTLDLCMIMRPFMMRDCSLSHGRYQEQLPLLLCTFEILQKYHPLHIGTVGSVITIQLWWHGKRFLRSGHKLELLIPMSCYLSVAAIKMAISNRRSTPKVDRAVLPDGSTSWVVSRLSKSWSRP